MFMAGAPSQRARCSSCVTGSRATAKQLRALQRNHEGPRCASQCIARSLVGQEGRLARPRGTASDLCSLLVSTMAQQGQQQQQEQEQQQQHLDCDSRALLKAVLLNGANKVVRRLLAEVARVRDSMWPGSFTALHAAAVSSCKHALPALLAAAAEQGTSVDSRLQFELHSRLYSEFLSGLGFAYDSGLDASEDDLKRRDTDGGVTPLYLACWEGSLDVIPILLAHGASAALQSDMTFHVNDIRHHTSGDALAHLLHGKGSKHAAKLVHTVKLLVEHGANPLAGVRGMGSSFECSYISDEGLPPEMRRCLVSFVKKHRRRLVEEAGVRMCGAALNGDGAALLVSLRELTRWADILFPDGATTCSGGICLVDVLEAAPLELADLVMRELPERLLVDRWKMLQRAVVCLQPKALRALLSVNRPRTFEGMVVDITYPCHTTYSCGHEPLGPCPVLLLMERLTRDHGYRTACSSHWEAKAVAVMAQLIEAGLKPSMYPEARCPEGKIVYNYDALHDHPGLLQKLPRPVLTALHRPAWSQAKHRDFPPAFRAAARAFLLAATASTRLCQQQQQAAQEGQPTAGVEQAGRGPG